MTQLLELISGGLKSNKISHFRGNCYVKNDDCTGNSDTRCRIRSRHYFLHSCLWCGSCSSFQFSVLCCVFVFKPFTPVCGGVRVTRQFSVLCCVLFVLVLCLVYSMLPVSGLSILNCPFSSNTENIRLKRVSIIPLFSTLNLAPMDSSSFIIIPYQIQQKQESVYLAQYQTETS